MQNIWWHLQITSVVIPFCFSPDASWLPQPSWWGGTDPQAGQGPDPWTWGSSGSCCQWQSVLGPHHGSPSESHLGHWWQTGIKLGHGMLLTNNYLYCMWAKKICQFDHSTNIRANSLTWSIISSLHLNISKWCIVFQKQKGNHYKVCIVCC